MIITIDRFEDIYAVCLTDSNIKIDIPKSLLPEDAREGSIYDMSFTKCCEKETRSKKRISEKAKKLWND